MEGTKVQNIDCALLAPNREYPSQNLHCPKTSREDWIVASVVERDGVARYREFVLEEYMDNFFSNAHDGKKSLDAIISLIQAYV
ncbi:hypothetical protein Peur_066899 [Populus x canadensis]|jgi:hypothetical protein